jgi:hypothetical protein
MIKRFVLVMIVASLMVVVQLGCGGGSDNVPRIAGAASTFSPKMMTPGGPGGPAGQAPKPD